MVYTFNKFKFRLNNGIKELKRFFCRYFFYFFRIFILIIFFILFPIVSVILIILFVYLFFWRIINRGFLVKYLNFIIKYTRLIFYSPFFDFPKALLKWFKNKFSLRDLFYKFVYLFLNKFMFYLIKNAPIKLFSFIIWIKKRCILFAKRLIRFFVIFNNFIYFNKSKIEKYLLRIHFLFIDFSFILRVFSFISFIYIKSILKLSNIYDFLDIIFMQYFYNKLVNIYNFSYFRINIINNIKTKLLYIINLFISYYYFLSKNILFLMKENNLNFFKLLHFFIMSIFIFYFIVWYLFFFYILLISYIYILINNINLLDYNNYLYTNTLNYINKFKFSGFFLDDLWFINEFVPLICNIKYYNKFRYYNLNMKKYSYYLIKSNEYFFILWLMEKNNIKEGYLIFWLRQYNWLFYSYNFIINWIKLGSFQLYNIIKL